MERDTVMMQMVLLWMPIILQNFGETFLLICMFRCFFGRPKKNMVLTCVGIGIVASVYCVILNTVHMPEYLRYGLTLGVFLLYAG